MRLACVLVALFVGSPAWSADLLVPAQFATIQAAIDAASDGDTVIVAPGTYVESINLLGKQITVRSSGGRGVTFIDGAGANRPVTASGSETFSGTLIEGFTLQNGVAGDGGGMLIETPASMTVRDCWFVNNRATNQGGGLHLQSVGFNTLIEDCTFFDNEATQGGGVSIFSGFPIVRDCEIIGNIANAPGGGRGAGMTILNFSQAQVIGCFFSGNAFESTFANGGRGGGIFIEQASPKIEGCTFRNHNAFAGGGVGGQGGGIWMRTIPGQSTRTLTLRDSVFEFNTAGTSGGGLHVQGVASTVVGCRFVGNQTTNTTGGGGGGIDAVFEQGGRFDGCEFIANTSANGGGMAVSLLSSFTLTNSLFVGNNATLSPTGSGGGLHTSNANVNMVACTFVQNTAASANGGAVQGTYNGSANASNVIAWGNAPGQITPAFGQVINVTHSLVQGGFAGAGNISSDPMFADADGPDDDPLTLLDNDYSLAMGSPAIDSGDTTKMPSDSIDRDNDGIFAEVTPWDVRGNVRLVDDPVTADTGIGPAPVIDMGAIEFQLAPAPCPGDIADDFGTLGADGMVSFGDFLALLGLIGPCPGGTPGCTGDIADDFGTLGADGMVSFGDFLAMLGLIGPCP